jgi:hypothetical protein
MYPLFDQQNLVGPDGGNKLSSLNMLVWSQRKQQSRCNDSPHLRRLDVVSRVGFCQSQGH